MPEHSNLNLWRSRVNIPNIYGLKLVAKFSKQFSLPCSMREFFLDVYGSSLYLFIETSRLWNTKCVWNPFSNKCKCNRVYRNWSRMNRRKRE